MNRRHIWVMLAAWVLLASSSAVCWGPEGHEIIVRHAIELLPYEIKPFYEANSRYVTAMVTLPDDWRETYRDAEKANHYIDLDLLSEPPFNKLIMDRASAQKKFGKEKLTEAGTLPWAIHDRWKRLVKAFKARDEVGIVVQSAVLAHYIGDAHVPFHVTKFYDGKTPEQKGIHFRWEENLVLLWLKPESIKPQSPEQVDDVLKSAFGWCIASFGNVDVILKADDKAREINPSRSYKYFRILFEDTEPILVDRLSCSSQATAGAIIAAWKAAGKPNLPGKPAALFWEM